MILQKLLGFDPKTMRKRTEVVAGATTFLTMCYILAVNPTILSTTGMDRGALFTSTAIAAAIATLLLAFMAKLPFAQAPSMGLNAFFAYTLCQAMGYSWQQSLAIMLIEGIVFLLITFINVREAILNAIPENLRHAISVGIGMFIAFIGLKNAGIIVSSPATFVTLGKFTPAAILGVIAILLSGVLMARKVKGALFVSIIATTVIGIPLGVTEIPSHWIPVSMPQSLSPIFCQFDFSGIINFRTLMVVISLLLVNIFDTVGTLVGLAYKTNIVRPDGTIPKIKEAMMRRTQRPDLVHARHPLHRRPLPLAIVHAHSKRGDKWRAGAGWRADARLGEASQPGGRERGFPGLYHDDNNGALLFHSRRHMPRHTELRHSEAMHGQMEAGKHDAGYPQPYLHSQLHFRINDT